MVEEVADLADQLVFGVEELGLLAFGKERLVLFGTFGEQEGAAGGDLQGPRGAAVGDQGREQSEADAGAFGGLLYQNRRSRGNGFVRAVRRICVGP